MRFAYLILAHKDLDQLQALIARLLRDDPEDRVILHYDRASPTSDDELASFAGRFAGAVSLAARTRCLWGHHSLVEAEQSLKQAADAVPYDYAHLLSGQDWPVGSKAELLQSLEPGGCYLSFEAPDMTDRMDDYHFHDRMLGPNPHKTNWDYRKDMALRGAARLWTRVKGKRGCPFGSSWKKGSAWWSLPKDVVSYTLPLVQQLIDTGRLRHTLCSDEHVMPSLLYHSPYADRLRDNRRFIRWTPGSSSPELLRAADKAEIAASGAWFARKVDRAVDPFFLAL